MFNAGTSTNVIALKVMQQLVLTTTTPYRNGCGRFKTCSSSQSYQGIKGSIVAYPYISVLMDVVVTDVPNMWGMVLSRIWLVILIGCLKMDLSYANIPTCDGYSTFHMGLAMRYQVEYLKEPMNEVLYIDEECGNLSVYAIFLALEKLEISTKESYYHLPRHTMLHDTNTTNSKRNHPIHYLVGRK